jgi:uncharacterized protein YjdB
MAKRKLAIIMTVLFIFTMLPGLALGGVEVSLDLSRDSAAVGDNITASGSADPDEWVSIKVVDSIGSIVVFDAVKSNADGKYSCKFIVPQVAPGTLTVVAGYGSNVANQTLTIGSGGGDTVAVTGVSLNKSSTIIVQGKDETLMAAVAPANASNKAVIWSSNKENVATVDEIGKVTGVNPGTATITVATVDGNKTAVCNITVTKPETVTSGGSVTIKDTPVTITVPQGVISSNITVKPDIAFPLVEVKAETSLGMVEMTIPEGTKIDKAPEKWDGTITLPEVKTKPSTTVTEAQQINAVIEVGLPDEEITFNKAVRLLLPGQKGKSAGFIRNGQFTEITTVITKDDQTTADNELVKKDGKDIKDGKVDTSADLAIWTKHFTEFIAYTPKTGGSKSKSSSGGSSITTTDQTIGNKGGTIKEAGAEVSFPVDAVSSDIKVTVKKLSSGIPAVSSQFKLLGEVYEITSDISTIFKKPVTITLPFDRNKVDNDKHDLAIYWWSNNQWVILDKIKVDLKAGKVSGEVNHFSKFAVLLSEKSATDTPLDEDKEPTKDAIAPVKATLKDITGHWAEASINQLVNVGAVSGYPDGTFKPDNTITRAEFATILVKAFNLEAKSGKVFSDTTGHWAKDTISTAAGHGIVSGYSASNFGPNNLITREQMAVMISKAANLSGGEGKTFADSAQIANWAKAAVAATSNKNIISGYPNNTFRPKAHATRAEAVTVIVKAVN